MNFFEFKGSLEMSDMDQEKSFTSSNEHLYREIDFLNTQVKRLELELERRQGNSNTCQESCASLNSIHDGLLRFVKQDGSLRCIFGNVKIQKMLGYDLHDMIGRRLTWFFSKDREIHRKVDLYIEDHTKGVTLETAFRTNSGTPIPVLCSVKPILDTKFNKNKEYIVLVIDIRALKAAQEQTKSVLHAERISTLGHLTASIAHEINNPLSFLIMDLDRQKSLYDHLDKIQHEMEGSLSSKSDFVSKDKLKPVLSETHAILKELDEMAQASADGLNRISEVVKAVKTFGKTDYGNERNEKMQIESAIDVAQKLINSKIKKSAIRLEKQFANTPMIKANMGRLVQVVLNLVLNSIQAIDHDKGIIIIRTFNYDESTIGFEVEDNGKGISPENMKRIFEPYFTTKPDGTGLGLGIINNIVHELGGKITVKSQLGKGTTFSIYLPLSDQKGLPLLIKQKPITS